MKKEKNDSKARRSYYTGKIVRSLLLLAFGELIFLAGLSDYRTESDLEAVFIFAFIVIGIALCNTLKYEKLRLGLDGVPKDDEKEKEKDSAGGGEAPEIPEKAAGAGDKAPASFEVMKSGSAKVFMAAAIVTAVVNAAAVIYLIRM